MGNIADDELRRVESFQYPAGHIGHLSANQGAALDGFKRLCEKEGYYKPAGAAGRDKTSHDDETLLRYLRARKFNQRDAFRQFKDTEDWRRKNELEKLYEIIDVEEYEQTRRLYPQWTGRRDKRGIPVYVYEVAGLDSRAISALEQSGSHAKIKSKESPKMLRLFALYENLTRFVMPLCSAIPNRPNPETPISQSNNIVDISKVGLKQFWNLKGHMQDASQLATAHYPETLDRIFIIGAPSFFPTVWGWIKRWFDPITVSKIFILSNQTTKTTLEQYIHIDNIPKKYGGNLDFQWGDMPLLEPAIEDALDWKSPSMQRGKRTVPTGPIRWQESVPDTTTMLAVGSFNGKQRHDVVATLKNANDDHRTPLFSSDPVNQGQGQGQGARSRLNAPAMFRTTTGNYTHPQEIYIEPQKVLVEDNVPHESMAQIPMDDQGRIQNPSQLRYRGGSSSEDYSNQDYRRESHGSSGTYLSYSGQSQQYPRGSQDYSASSLEQPSLAQAEPSRSGSTSSTLYDEQSYTHASGNSASRTPAVVDYGHGDKVSVTEPSTVGQAPKDVSVPTPEPPAGDSSYIEQAKAIANSAYETGMNAVEAAMGAVGLGGAGADNEDEEREKASAEAETGKERKLKDPSMAEKVSDQSVEDFLRDQYASSHPGGHKK